MIRDPGSKRWCIRAIAVCALVNGFRHSAGAELDWQTANGSQSAPLIVSASSHSALSLLAPNITGITFSNRLSDAMVATNRLTELGSGVALGDVDGDGWVDMYFCRLEGNNVLYRNLGGWKFQDITLNSGVSCHGQLSTGCTFADIDGDGDLDLIVNSLGGGTRAFLNRGNGQFEEMTDTQLARRSGATSLALADVDGDSDLDLYVTHYRTDTFHDHPPGLRITTRQGPNGALVIEPENRFIPLPVPNGGFELLERGEGDALYINRGQGRFFPIRWDVGVFLDERGLPVSGAPTDWGLSVMFRDLNGDRLPDLYVCNDFVYWPDRIWLNQNGKRFQAAPVHMFRNFSLSSMAVDVADINRDGFDDIFVAEMLGPRRESRAWQRPDMLKGVVDWPIEDPAFRPEVTRNTLHLARGDGTFAEIAQFAGVSATDWTWGVAFVDVDLDGWEDLLAATGNNHDVQDADVLAAIVRAADTKTPDQRLRNLRKMPRRHAASMALRNRGDLTFEDASSLWGFNESGIAHGLALADLDNDGDLDVVMNCLNAPARVYRSNAAAPRIAVRLKGTGNNTRGIGAKIRVTGGPVPQSQEMISGGRYCSGDDAMRVFAAGNALQLRIEVTWRSGKRSVVENAKPNHVYAISESAAMHLTDTAVLEDGGQRSEVRDQGSDVGDRRSILFEDVSMRLNHAHVDEPFDDFKRQPLLPRKLSSLGPGIAWIDLDADGDDDLIVGAGKGGRLAVFRNDGTGGFQEWANAIPSTPNTRDQTGLVAWAEADGGVRLGAGESIWDDADTNAAPFRIFAFPPNASGTARHQNPAPGNESRLNRNTIIHPAPPGLSATGPLALADIDNDDDLDLFVGGRVASGRYPEPASSQLLLNQSGAFTLARPFPSLGLVSAAVFTDLDADGDPDLALALDWDSVRLFHNHRGEFTEVTKSFGISELKGWWNGIAAGDFDGDGRMDLVASNWGRNWRTDQPHEIPVQLFYGEFGGNGVVHTLLASTDPALGFATPWRERKAVAAAIPSVIERLPNHRAYGRASALDVIGNKTRVAGQLQASVLDSMIFLNRGDYFEPRKLPVEAQFAPAFGVSVADFDSDGREDVFLSQNFFGVDAETSRHDAGVGLVLLGDGNGNFRALNPREAGFAIYGEQRGSAVADFDHDGRADLVVTQNNGATKLLRNIRGTQGVRVTLRGPKGNPVAIGAVVRLKFAGSIGPAREIHAGSGYWSQDSSTLILAAASAPSAIWVRWPGGKEQEWPWPPGSRSVRVSVEVGIRRH